MIFFILIALIGLAWCNPDYPNAPPFTLPAVLRINAISLAITCHGADIKAWTCTWCQLVPDVTFVAIATNTAWEGETKVLIAYSKTVQQVYVMYQGSHNLPNWVLDFDFPKTSYPNFNNSYVHRGFYYGYTMIEAQVRQHVDSALQSCPQCKEVVVGGHSYGAALSVFTAIDLAMNPPASGLNKPQLWNFGQPRVGDKTFVDTLMKSRLLNAFYRSTHIYDPVPHLPMVFFGFYHAGQEIYNDVYNGTSFVVCDGSGEDPNCSNSIPSYEYDVFAHLIYFGYDTHFGPHACEGLHTSEEKQLKKTTTLIRDGFRKQENLKIVQ